MMGKRSTYGKISCVQTHPLAPIADRTLSPQTLFAFKPSRLLHILKTKFRYVSAIVKRQSALGSLAMSTPSLGVLETGLQAELPYQKFIT